MAAARVGDKQRVLITGATGAIGAALARAHAGRGYHLILQGRDRVALEALADYCEECGATAAIHALELDDVAAARAWMVDQVARAVPDRVIFSAGMNTHIGVAGAGKECEAVQSLLRINLASVMAMVDPLAQAMRAQGCGQLVFIGSLAGDYGLALTPAYSASKAGLRAYSEALSGWLRPAGVRINLVTPGYVHSPMSRVNAGPHPSQWHAGPAAARIVRGMDRDQTVIRFPFWLALGTWLLRMLPAGLSRRILHGLGYGPPRH